MRFIDGLFDVLYYIMGRVTELVEEIGTFLFTVAIEIGPWSAPLAPAALSYFQLISPEIGFPPFVALIVAIAIESVGLASAGTLVTISQHNRGNKAKKNRLPEVPMYFFYGWYMITVISLNVVLQYAKSLNILQSGELIDETFAWIVIGVHALLVLLAIPASAVIGYRASFKKVISEIEGKKEKVSRQKLSDSRQEGEKVDWRHLTPYEHEQCKKMFPDEIRKAYPGVSKKSSLNWTELRR